MKLLIYLVVIFTGAVLAITSCSDKKNPIAAFQPEVINNADAFQFQVTNASNVSTTLNYSWANTGTSASVNHSTARTQGSAVVRLATDGSGRMALTASAVLSADLVVDVSGYFE